MSMLAERKRKTKWVLNPTKKPLWVTDSNGMKFGKELMEKMGWSTGKGLGATEQGIQEPLRVSYKNDTKGMGFKGNDEDWIEQQDEFNELLSQLRSDDVKISEEEKNQIKSLEEKSKHSRARVHYQKFTRGKDLSRYSENDLACILGTTKTKKEKHKTEEVAQTDERANVRTDSQLETSFGVTTINSGSIHDYFKKKWTNSKVQLNNTSAADKEKGECYDDERPSFTVKGQESAKLESEKQEDKPEDGFLYVGETNVTDFGEKSEKKKKRKKKDVQMDVEEEPESKRKKNDHVESQDDVVDVTNNKVKESLLENESGCDLLKKKKKEKKHLKLKEGEETDEKKVGAEVNSVQDTGFVENCYDNDLGEVKKKKKKDKKEKSVGKEHCNTQEVSFTDPVDSTLELKCEEREEESVRKKRKKAKHQDEVFDDVNKENVKDPSLELSLARMNGTVKGENFMDEKQKKKKKKCKDYDRNFEIGETNLQQDNLGKNDFNQYDNTEVTAKKKKKKKEKEEANEEYYTCQNGISNDIPVERSDVAGDCEDLEQSKKKKKKEEKHEPKEKNCSSDQNQEACLEENGREVVSDPSEKEAEKVKKKKKKKHKNEIEEKENCSGDQNQEVCLEENSREDISVPFEKEAEKIKKKKKKKNKHEVEEKENCSNDQNQEARLEENGREVVSDPSEEEIEKRKKKKKKKDKKEKAENKNELPVDEQEEETKDSCSGVDSQEVKSAKKKKREGKLESGERKEDGSKMAMALADGGLIQGEVGNPAGNAEIGVTGVDKVERIFQRAAYEHVPGQHRYERVKAMIQCANLSRFRGSNLEELDGYGCRTAAKCETSGS